MRSFWSFLIKSRLISGSTPRRPRRRAGDTNAGGPTVRVSRQTYLKLLGVQQSVLNQFNQLRVRNSPALRASVLAASSVRPNS
jgi:hypothetical protein